MTASWKADDKSSSGLPGTGEPTADAAAVGSAPGSESRSEGRVTRAGDLLSIALSVLQAVFFAITVVVVLVEVFVRYVLNGDFTDSDEILILSFTWLVFLGIPRAVWLDYSPRLGVSRSWPKSLRAYLPGAGLGAMCALFAVDAWSFFVLAPTQAETTLAPLPLPSYWASAAVLVASVAGIMLAIARAVVIKNSAVHARIVGGAVGVVVVLLPVLLQLPLEATAIAELLVLLALDCPIAVALGGAGASLIVNGSLSQISAVANQLVGPMQNLALLAIPLFMLMGALFAESRLARDLSNFVRSLLGWLPGGTGVACVGTSAIFANISGSAIADTAAIGSVYIPQLIDSGYESSDAAALQAAAGVIGVVFPPAIAMILFASVANVPIIPVFKAVVIPGLMIALTMTLVCIMVARRRGIPRSGRFSGRSLLRSLPGAVPVLFIPLILDGGIFSGVFTPEESGAVATLVIVIFIISRRGLTFRAAGRALAKGMDNMTLVMFILTSVSLLDYGFAASGISDTITNLLSHVSKSPLLMLIVINLIFLIVHEFVDAGPTIIVLVPLVLPAATAAGVNPLQLAAVIAINSTIGAVLPPVGVNLYVSSRMANVDPRSALRRVWPYVAGSAVVLVLVTVIPALSLWLAG
jgi:C4-dicarboxylate transporter DctM subunit